MTFDPSTPRDTPTRLGLVVAAACGRRPVLTLVLLGLATALFAAALPRLVLDTDGATLRPPDHPAVERTAADRTRFLEPERVVLLATSRGDAGDGVVDLHDRRGLAALVELDRWLRYLPEVDGSAVFSPATLLAPPPAEGVVTARTVVPEHPAGASASELAAVRDELDAHPLARRFFFSADGEAAVFVLSLAAREDADPKNDDRPASIRSLEERLAEVPATVGERLALRLTGPAVAEARLGERVVADLVRLAPLLVLATALLLAGTLRSPAGVALPMVSILGVLIWTFGAMAAVGLPVTLATTILPVLLVAFTVADEIHLLERLGRFLGEASGKDTPGTGDAVDRATLERSLQRAYGAVARPIVLTSTTTAAALLSFLAADLPPLRWFGVATAFGILVAMGFTFTLVPALAALLPPRWFVARGRSHGGGVVKPAPGRSTSPARRRLARLARLAPWAGLAILALALPGLARLQVQDAWMANFDADDPLVTAEAEINRRFAGTYTVDLVLEHPRPHFFASPEGAAAAEAATAAVAETPGVGATVSHLALWEELARVRGIGLPLSVQPDLEVRRAAALGELVSRRVGLRQLLTSDGRAARLRLHVPSPSYRTARALVDELDGRLRAALGPPATPATPTVPTTAEQTAETLSWHLSGDLPLAIATVDAVVHDMLRSVAWTLVAVAALLAFALGSPRRALATVAPVAAAVAAVLGAMGWLGVPLGVATSTFAALCLGAGVDFAIHLEAAQGRRLADGLGPREAGRQAAALVERPLRFNTVVLAGTVLVLVLSNLGPNRALGLLLAGALVASYAATLALGPALLARAGHGTRAATENT